MAPKLTEEDIQVVNAMLITKDAGTVIHESHIVQVRIQNIPGHFMMGYILNIDSVLPMHASVYVVKFIIAGKQMQGFVIVEEGVSMETAILRHCVDLRDITYIPVPISKDRSN